MNRKYRSMILLLIVIFLCSGCSSVHSSVKLSESKSGYIYSVSESVGKEIIFSALSDAFPDTQIAELSGSVMGYSIIKTFMLDSHTVYAQMKPVEGDSSTGEAVYGYIFEVGDNGTMPITVGSKAKGIYETIIENASDVATPVYANNIKQISGGKGGRAFSNKSNAPSVTENIGI